MSYFKNIHEFIKEFNGNSGDITTYDRNLKKSITKIQYKIRIGDFNVSIIKYKGRYQSYIQKTTTTSFTEQIFIVEGGCWEKIELDLLKLDIFTQFVRDKKLEGLFLK